MHKNAFEFCYISATISVIVVGMFRRLPLYLYLKMTKKKKEKMRRPGIEPGSTAWKAAMLTTIPPTQ